MFISTNDKSDTSMNVDEIQYHNTLVTHDITFPHSIYQFLS